MAEENEQVDEEAAAPEAPEAPSDEPAKPVRRARAKKAAEPVAEAAGDPIDELIATVPDLPATTPEDAAEAGQEGDAIGQVIAEASSLETPKKRTPRAKPLKKQERPKERKPHVRAPRPPKAEGRRKERRGIVVSAAMDKTITIRIDHAKPHPKYHKIVRRSTRLHAHDERNEAGVGDVVRIVETRPLSKLKRWRMVEIVEKAK